jgi:hypothetical protein
MLGTGITDLTRPVRLRDSTEHTTGQVAFSKLVADEATKGVLLHGDPPRARIPIQREPHWNVAVLLPSALVVMLEVIGKEPYLWQ